jgi:hypothetical protein
MREDAEACRRWIDPLVAPALVEASISHLTGCVEKQHRQPGLLFVGLPESKRERDQCARTHPLGMSRAAPLVVGAGIKLSTLTPERLEATTSQ